MWKAADGQNQERAGVLENQMEKLSRDGVRQTRADAMEKSEGTWGMEIDLPHPDNKSWRRREKQGKKIYEDIVAKAFPRI